MLNIIILLFALAAIAGLLLLLKILKEDPTSKLLVVAHGALAAFALVLLVTYVAENYEGGPVLSLGLFTVAAIGGFVLLVFDIRKKKVPKTLAFVHAGAAVVAFLLLLMFAFSI